MGFFNETRYESSDKSYYTTKRFSDFLSLEGTLRYKIASCTVFTGLAYRIEMGSVKTDWSNPNAKDWSAGAHAFAIPFRLEWTF